MTNTIKQQYFLFSTSDDLIIIKRPIKEYEEFIKETKKYLIEQIHDLINMNEHYTSSVIDSMLKEIEMLKRLFVTVEEIKPILDNYSYKIEILNEH